MDTQRFHSIVRGYWESQILFSAVTLGIFDLLKKGEQDSEGIATDLSLNREGMELFMNSLTALGFVRKKGGLFKNSAFTQKHLVTGAKEPMYGFPLHLGAMWEQWGRLPEILRKRRSGKRGSSRGKARSRKEIYSFALAMHHGGTISAREIARLIDFSHVTSILDIGGCTGRYSMEIFRKFSSKKVHILDLPEMAREAKKILRALDPEAARTILYIKGNFFHTEPPEKYDLAILSNILHSLDGEECRRLIARIKGWLAPNGRLLIHDMEVDKSGTKPAEAALFAINMVVNTPGGKVYSAAKLVQFARSAGFKKVQKQLTMRGRLVLLCE